MLFITYVCKTIGAFQDHSTEFIEKEKDTESPQEDKVLKINFKVSFVSL